MTSNLGSQFIQQQFEKLNGTNRDEIVETAKKGVLEMLKKTIRPEFLNRIDDIIMFQPLTKAQIKDVVKLQIGGVAKMLNGNGITLKLEDSALDFLANVGYDPEFGARPVKRAIQNYLLNDLSKRILSGEINREKPIVVEAANGSLTFKN